MRGVRAGTGAVLAVAAALALAGCDPYPHTDVGGTAAINIQVEPDGTAETDILFDGSRVRTDAELLAAGEAAAGVFTNPGAISHVSINRNDYGYPFTVVTTTHVFAAGPDPIIGFDTTDVVSHLLAHGATSVDVGFGVTSIPMEADSHPAASAGEADWASWWSVASPSSAPHGAVVLHPEPNLLRAFWAAIGPLVALAALLLAIARLFARKHRSAVTLGIIALSASVLALAANGFDEVAQLAASGGPGWPYAVFALAMLSTLVVFIPGSAAVLVLGLTKRPRVFVVYNPPPGWAEPELGWLPYPSWWPESSWPAAPPSWQFLAECSRRAPNVNRSRRARAEARAWVRRYNEAVRLQGRVERTS